MKRAFDLFFATALLILSIPILLISAMSIRWAMGSPVLFVQRRPGFGARPFSMLKFRTMDPVDERRGISQADGPRVTRLGRVLRSLSIDELPSLWNVIRGDMSLVGPRPLLMDYLPLYTSEQARRHEVRPGLTGLAQVSGRNAISWEEKFALDVWYVDNRSFLLDLKILLLTVHRVLKRDGINASSNVTAKRFIGSQRIDDVE